MESLGIPVAEYPDRQGSEQALLFLALMLEAGSVSASTAQAAPIKTDNLSRIAETGPWPAFNSQVQSRFVL